MTTDHLKFSPDILRRLGEELIPHPDQGVVELVRNAYDADATRCTVSIQEGNQPGGTIVVADDGSGMDLNDIRNGWLLIGRSSKALTETTPLGRRPVGNKGLGRLAALRLGHSVRLTSRPRTERNVEYELTIDWDEFEAASTVEGVALSIVSRPRSSGAPNGTEVTLQGLRKPLSQADVERLARSIILLADPFEHRSAFVPTLSSPAFKQLERVVRGKYFDQAEYRLEAKVDANGRGSATAFDASGRKKWIATHEDLRGNSHPFKCPALKFDLWMFLLSTDRFRIKSAPLKNIREWLQVFGGVHLYHRGLRVHPYGDPGFDWLDMNLRRAQSPEERPSTNNSIGRVIVDDPNDRLLQKTDRIGFVENESFQELKRFATSALDWVSKKRLEAKEKTRRSTRKRASKAVTQARDSMRTLAKTLPRAYRAKFEVAFDKYEHARKREVSVLSAEVQLYRTLSTIGTTFAVFAHEVESPAKLIRKLAETIERRAQRDLGFDAYKETLQESVQTILKSTDELSLFPRVALHLLDSGKRRAEIIPVHDVISETVEVFRPMVNAYGVKIECEFTKEIQPQIYGTVAALESIVANLISNSVNAFLAEDAPRRAREIRIKTEAASNGTLLIHVLDTGPGIRGLSTDEIWLPGRTSYSDGSGLGLTIVRDAVQDLGGRARAMAKGELGGAEIVLQLPLSTTIQ